MEHDLREMKIGERIGSGDMEILRVPMGWIFYRTYQASVTGTFVPDLAPQQKKNRIIQ